VAIACLIATPFIGILTKKSKPIKVQQIAEVQQVVETPVSVETAPKQEITTPEPVVQPQTGVEQYRPLVVKYFPPSEVETALAIMSKESGGNSQAVSATNDHGLFQLHAPLWTNFFGVTTEQLKDPETNVKLAAVVWSRSSWKAWSTYTH